MRHSVIVNIEFPVCLTHLTGRLANPRGENYISVLDGEGFREKLRIEVPNGPGMTIFSPDGKYGYICSSFSPETVVIATDSHKIIGRVKQESPYRGDPGWKAGLADSKGCRQDYGL